MKSHITDKRDERFNIRAKSHYQKAIISEAAKIKNTTISNFVLSHAYEAAQAIIAHETQLKLPQEQWEAFCQALDREPQNKPAIRKLLTESDVFDSK